MFWWVLFLKQTYTLFLSGSKFHLVKNCITNSTSNTVWLSIYHAPAYYSTYIARALFCICLLRAVYKYILIKFMWNSVNNTILQFNSCYRGTRRQHWRHRRWPWIHLVSGSRVQFHREKTGPRNAFCINKLLLYFSLFIHTKSG